MNHKDLKENLAQYVSGELDEGLRKVIECHLNKCPDCQKEVAALQESLLILDDSGYDDELSQQRIERILRRSRRKTVIIGGLLSTLVLAVILLCLYAVNVVASSVPGPHEEVVTAAGLSILVTQPGVEMWGSGTTIQRFGNATVEADLGRYIGERRWKAGTLHGEYGLVAPGIFRIDWLPERQTQYHFLLPDPDAVPYTSLVWRGLERLPSGTAAEMAFSLDSYYDLLEVPALPGQSLEISWYALDSGEGGNFDLSGYPDVFYPFGISKGYTRFLTEMPEDVRSHESSGGFTYLEPPFPEGFLEKIAWLAERPERFRAVAPWVHRAIPIEERYAYLKENGLRAYGIVVHGPVEELLLLRDMPQFRQPQLGPVEWWLPAN